jgi:hypothetical protein
MKWLAGFAAGAVIGALVMQTVLARNERAPPRPERGLNHVGIVVEDYAAAHSFYTEMLGLREAYFVEQNGRPLSAYLELDAAGIALEIMEFGLQSQQYRAMAAWQP